jgi:hypothetical protein
MTMTARRTSARATFGNVTARAAAAPSALIDQLGALRGGPESNAGLAPSSRASGRLARRNRTFSIEALTKGPAGAEFVRT